jgi:hypothetical protein
MGLQGDGELVVRCGLSYPTRLPSTTGLRKDGHPPQPSTYSVVCSRATCLEYPARDNVIPVLAMELLVATEPYDSMAMELH